ncbi:MAG: chemotaxis protein, partial [Oxalobacteraceae bacterium]
NQAITNMDGMTQQNAALVEEAAAAAGSLQDQADNLVQVVSLFKLDDMHPTTAMASIARQRRTVPTQAIIKPFSKKPGAVRIAADNRIRVKQGTNIPAQTNEEWEQF